MYFDVELGFIGNLIMSVFIIVGVVGAIKGSGVHIMPDEKRRAIDEKNRRDWEAWMAKHQKEHPDIWDENGNVR